MQLSKCLRPTLLLAAVFAGGCVSYKPVPLTDGQFPRGSIQVGDEVRIVTRDGESRKFSTGGVENGVLTTQDGERIDPATLTSLERKSYDKKNTIITLSVIGGIIVTAIAIDAVDDCEDDPFCSY
jgi:hypothetical protein